MQGSISQGGSLEGYGGRRVLCDEVRQEKQGKLGKKREENARLGGPGIINRELKKDVYIHIFLLFIVVRFLKYGHQSIGL